jgi:hypothetical protein
MRVGSGPLTAWRSTDSGVARRVATWSRRHRSTGAPSERRQHQRRSSHQIACGCGCGRSGAANGALQGAPSERAARSWHLVEASGAGGTAARPRRRSTLHGVIFPVHHVSNPFRSETNMSKTRKQNCILVKSCVVSVYHLLHAGAIRVGVQSIQEKVPVLHVLAIIREGADRTRCNPLPVYEKQLGTEGRNCKKMGRTAGDRISFCSGWSGLEPLSAVPALLAGLLPTAAVPYAS